MSINMTKIEKLAFNENGFALLKGFFNGDEIEAIRLQAKAVFFAQMKQNKIVTTMPDTEAAFDRAMFKLFESNLDTFINCGKQVQHLISLHRLSLDERIMQELQAIGLSFPNISTRPVLFFNSKYLAKKETYWRVFAHQDWRSMQGSLDSIVVWIPLIDIPKELGALEIVPKSHTVGLVAERVVDSFGVVEGYDDTDFVGVEVEQGDALFFSSFLIHRSGTNVTDLIRWSCHFRYNNLDETTFIERGYPHNYIYKASDELITPMFPTPEQVRKIYSTHE